MGAMLILACLSWYYWDEVRAVTPTVINYFRRPRSGNDDTGLEQIIQEWILEIFNPH